jgi:hypothetical protein
MNRRSLLKGALGAAGAIMGALAVRSGVDGREAVPEGVPGQSATRIDADPIITASEPFGGGAGFTIANASLVTGPDASMEAYCESFVNEAIDRVFPNTSLVTGPDPDTMVHIRFDEAENAAVVPPGMETPNETSRWWAIPRALFPEYDPAHGIVPLPMFVWSHSGDDDLALIRSSY